MIVSISVFLKTSSAYRETDTPYAAQGKEIMTLIRKKAPEDDIQPLINQIQEEAASLGVEDVLIPSTDAYVTAICFVGSKSLSHVLSCIERCKERLLAIGPESSGARRQIISSVMEYWKDQSGVGVNIIDKLLNYTILDPMSVIEWVLLDHTDGGKNLIFSHIYEMVSTTVFKVTNRVRQIVTARNQAGLPDPQVKMLDETLEKERAEQGDLFKVIEDALLSIAQGSQDEMMENGDGSTGEEALVRAWGERWLRVFRRKFAVEEAFINEAVLPSAETEAEAHETTNGADGEVL